LLLGLTICGTAGYMILEGWSLLDALYMTITTLATVGYGEVHPLHTAGRIFTLIFIIIGVGTTFYVLTSLVVFVVEGHFSKTMGRRRMERAIARLADHFIICGYGRVGRQIVHEFSREGTHFVIIDINQTSLADAGADGHLTITGTPAGDDVLQRAGIAKARGLIAAMDNDAENIYVTLSARVLRPDLFILARANQPDSEPKLQRAGANRIISPYRVGGRQMAMLALRPLSVDFVDTVLQGLNMELILEDIGIKAGSTLVGITLAQVRTAYLPEASILALKRGTRVTFNPSMDTLLEEGDQLAVIGTPAQLKALEGAS
ncbi:MAG TPA: potassium channel protein, partial [Chloroflexota bacterium]|nr:potassium channel protein [Chloroflexota bacterium]